MESMSRNTVALCGCGGLTAESFCEGTRSKIGFRLVWRAVRREVRQV